MNQKLRNVLDLRKNKANDRTGANPVLLEWHTKFSCCSNKWYLFIALITLWTSSVVMIFYFDDMLFGLFLAASSVVLILYANKKSEMSKIKIDQTGVSIDNRTYCYSELKSFWIDYSPQGPKELSLELKKWYLPYAKISLADQGPLEIKALIIQFVPEKLHEQSLIDFIGKKLGL